MAPKSSKPDKAKVAAKQKQAEDKTFGLKNKSKSAKVQKYVQTVQQGATQVGDRKLQALNEKAAEAKKKKKAEEEARKRELDELFSVAIKQPKVPVGVDPKSIVCEFFRHGQCTKGFKCKFSHDLSVERKTAKIDLFTDRRDGEEEGEGGGGMDDWDQEQLEKVVREKHATSNKNNPTNIICKFFLEAVEKRVYGWFWKCPNGSDCKYRHALPPGYVLKSQMKELLEEEAAKNSRDVTEVIEEERRKVAAKTPITQEVFAGWHARRTEARRKAREEADDVRRKKGLLNGREIFLQDNFVAQDDAGASEAYVREDDDEARINDMFEQARVAAEKAREDSTAAEEADDAAAAAAAGPSGTAAAGGGAPGPSGAAGSSSGASSSRAAEAGSSSAAPATNLQLTDADAALFDDDDDDDDEELEEEDE